MILSELDRHGLFFPVCLGAPQQVVCPQTGADADHAAVPLARYIAARQTQ